MRYRLTCLTPLLVGDGRKLSPIDYMVWKDHVNVLDQWRIFRLLAKGPRLDGYLTQLKNADKLDFASWGGFAQNFAGRRIPFENAAYSAYWNRAIGRQPAHPHLRHRRLRTVSARHRHQGRAAHRHGLRQLARRHAAGRRGPRARASACRAVRRRAWKSRRWARRHEPHALRRARAIPRPSPRRSSRSTCCAPPRCSRAAAASRSAGSRARAAPWMARARTTARRSSPRWPFPAPPSKAIGRRRRSSCSRRSAARVRWPESFDRAKIFEAANVYAAGLLAAAAPVRLLDRPGSAGQEPRRTGAAAGRTPARRARACSRSAGAADCPPRAPGSTPPTPTTARFCSSSRIYNRALATNLPFPKTRRIVFLNNKPATLPGWAELSVEVRAAASPRPPAVPAHPPTWC